MNSNDKRIPGNTSSTKKDNMESRQTFKFLPVRTCDMDFSEFGLPSASKTGSAQKPIKYAIPVRTCDMDPSIFVVDNEPQKKSKVCKQLYSEKRSTRYTTTFKPERNVRKSVIAKPLSNSVRKMFEAGQDKDKQSKLLQPTTKFIKPPNILQIPTIKVHKPAQICNDIKSVNKYTCSNNKEVDAIPDKFDELENKWESRFKEFSSRLTKLELGNKEILNRLAKLELTAGCKNCNCKNMFTKEDQTYEIKVDEKCSSSKIENLSVNKKTPIKLNVDYSFTKKSTPEVNNLINDALSSIEINNAQKTREAKTKEEETREAKIIEETTSEKAKTNEEKTTEPTIKYLTPKTSNIPIIFNKRKNNNKILIDSNKKPINKFEILESKLKYGSPMSDEISLSDTESPAIVRTDINWLLNDKNDQKSPIYKSLSTFSLATQNKRKTVTFQSQSDLQLNTVSKYNEMRNNAPFLCTPKNTRFVSNLMTPSAENSQKKKLSRRIQEQLILLE